MTEILTRQPCTNSDCDEGMVHHKLWLEIYRIENERKERMPDYEIATFFARNGFKMDKIPSPEVKCPTCKGIKKVEVWIDINVLKQLL